MRKQFWNEALNRIDEKYINETAQAHFKRNGARSDSNIEIEERPSTSAKVTPLKKSRHGAVIGALSAAAAVTVAVIGGTIWLNRGQIPVDSGDSTSQTSSVTNTDNTIRDIVTDEDGNIVFEKDYVLGHIEFQPAEKLNWLYGGGIISSFEGMSDHEIHEYVKGFSGVSTLVMGNSLRAEGYTEDRERFMWNSLYETYPDSEYTEMDFVKDDARIMLNIRQENGDQRYIRLPDDDIIIRPEDTKERSFLLDEDMNAVEIYLCGKVIDGVPYYYAEYQREQDGKPIYVTVSAMGCSVEDIVHDVLGGLICQQDELEAARDGGIAPFSAELYNFYNTICEQDGEEGTMTLEENMSKRFIEIFDRFEEVSDTPEFFGEVTPSHPTAVQGIKDSAGDRFDLIRLYEDEQTGRCYYYYDNYNDPPFFEISREHYDELTVFYDSYTVHIYYAVVGEDRGNGYYVTEELIEFKSGGEEYAVGDDVRIEYYGEVMETYPAQIHQINAMPWYQLWRDTDPIWEDVRNEQDWLVFERLLAHTWQNRDNGNILDWSYKNSDNATGGFPYSRDGYGINLFGGDKGRYMTVTRGGETTLYFMDNYGPMTLYVYPKAEGIKYNEYVAVYDYVTYTPEEELQISGELNSLGVSRFLADMDEDFRQLFYDIHENGFTDINGDRWVKSPSLAQDYGKFELESYSENAVQYREMFYDPALLTEDVLNGHADSPEGVYFLITAERKDGKWTSTAERQTPEGYKTECRDAFGYMDVVLEYTTNGKEVQYIKLYTCPPEDTDDRTYAQFVSGVLPENGGEIPEGTELLMQKLSVSGGDMVLIYVPVSVQGTVAYMPSIYAVQGNELIRMSYMLNGGKFTPIKAYSAYANNSYNANIITFETTGGTAVSYTVDFGSNSLDLLASPPESADSVTTITIDMTEAQVGAGMGEFVSSFHGEWGNGYGVLDFRMNPAEYYDNFAQGDDYINHRRTAAEVFGDKKFIGWCNDKSGCYMYLEDELWFIRIDDRNTMFRFTGIADGQTVQLSECTEVYQRIAGMEGFYRGSLPLGYFGRMEIEEYLGIDLSALEFTDESGAHWVSADEGDIYYAAVQDGTENVYQHVHVKMKNTDSGETRYFSTAILDISEPDGSYSVGEKHFSFDASVCDPTMMSTEKQKDIWLEIESDRHGWFTMPVTFFPLDGERYYAVREYGNTQGQWTRGAELFYHDENGYTQVDTEAFGAFFFVAHEGLLYAHCEGGLDIYDGAQLVRRVPFAEAIRMGAGGFGVIADRYIVAEDSEITSVYDTVTEKYIMVARDEAKFSYDDGETTIAIIRQGKEYFAGKDGDTLSELFG